MSVRHFLTLNDLSRDELRDLIQRAIELKAKQKAGDIFEPLKNKGMYVFSSRQNRLLGLLKISGDEKTKIISKLEFSRICN